MIKSHATTKSEMKLNWHFIDAKDKVLGRLATDISVLLQGKHKANYVTYLNCGDKVVVYNSKYIALTGNKEQQKLYKRHSGYAGSLQELTAEQVRRKDSTRMIKDAVVGMLPKNRLRNDRMANLYIYEDEKHPHQAQIGGQNGGK